MHSIQHSTLALGLQLAPMRIHVTLHGVDRLEHRQEFRLFVLERLAVDAVVLDLLLRSLRVEAGTRSLETSPGRCHVASGPFLLLRACIPKVREMVGQRDCSV